MPPAPLFNLGLKLALPFAGFMHFIHDRIKQHRSERVFFLSREGRFFQRAFERWSATTPSTILELSRLSTFLPSMKHFSIDELMRIWECFPRQSPRGLLQSLLLDTEAMRHLVARHELNLDEQLNQPWKDPRMVALVSDPAFAAEAKPHRDRMREMLLGYLGQTGFSPLERALVVDIGWRGTIQDSLSLVAPRTSTLGLYLCHRPAEIRQPPNVEKIGFLAGREASGEWGQEIRFCASPLEMLCLSSGGSAIGFSEQAGEIRPVRRGSPVEEAVLSDDIPHIQEGILAGIPMARDWFATQALDLGACRVLSQVALKKVLFRPSKALVSTYQRFRIDATFGHGSHDGTLRMVDALLAPISERHWLALRQAVQRHGWPHLLLQQLLGRHGFEVTRRVAISTARGQRWFA